MDLRSCSITADILNFLTDGKIHKMKDIAAELEIHINTVQKHIQSLSYRYPIETFCNGNKGRGVILDKNYIFQGRILNNDELQVINQSLLLLQQYENNAENLKIIKTLLSIYSTSNKKEIANGN